MNVRVNSCEALKRYMEENAIESKYYIDRIDIRVNDLSKESRVAKIIARHKEKDNLRGGKITPIFENKNYKMRPEAIRRAVGFKIELYNVWKRKPISVLAKALVGAHYSISWIELAYDIKTSNEEKAVEMLNILANFVVVPMMRTEATGKHSVTMEIAERGEKRVKSLFIQQPKKAESEEEIELNEDDGESGKKRMFKMYIPEEGKKIYGSQGVHMEFFLKGAIETRSAGIRTLFDLASLEAESWFKQRLLVMTPKKNGVGEQYRKSNGMEDASDRQYQKDYERVFGDRYGVSHHLYHLKVGKRKVYRRSLTSCSNAWMTKIKRGKDD